MNGACMPLPTDPQQYCDPASLVLIVLNRRNSESDRTTETDGSDEKLCCDVNLKSVPCVMCMKLNKISITLNLCVASCKGKLILASRVSWYGTGTPKSSWEGRGYSFNKRLSAG